MEKNLSGVDLQDLAHLQNMSEEGAVGAQPQGMKNVDEMEDGEFLEYLNRVKDGEKPFEENSGTEAQNSADENKEENKEPFIKFNTQEEYQQDFNSKFSKRHKDFKGVLDVGHEVYGKDLSDSELLEKIKSDMVAAAANNNGKTTEEFQSELELKQKAEAYDRLMKGENDKKEVVNRWMSEAESLKSIHPDFDFEKALENPQFMESLTQGKSVAESFISSMLNKKQAPMRAIKQNASQLSSGSTARRDPAQMSDAEFDKYINGIKGNY